MKTFLNQFKTCGKRYGLICHKNYFDWYDLSYFDPWENRRRNICRLVESHWSPHIVVWDYRMNEYGKLHCNNLSGRRISFNDLEDFVMDFARLAKKSKKNYRKQKIEQL